MVIEKGVCDEQLHPLIFLLTLLVTCYLQPMLSFLALIRVAKPYSSCKKYLAVTCAVHSQMCECAFCYYNKALLRTEKAIFQYYKVLLQSTTPVLLCTTKYYSVLQSTTLYYRLQSTTPYYKVLLQYFKVPLQYYKVLLRTTKHYSSTTKKYYSVLQSTTPVLLCTTKYYSSTVPYYSALQSTTKCYKVLLRTERVLHEMSLTLRGATGVILQHHQILCLPLKMILMMDPCHK